MIVAAPRISNGEVAKDAEKIEGLMILGRRDRKIGLSIWGWSGSLLLLLRLTTQLIESLAWTRIGMNMNP